MSLLKISWKYFILCFVVGFVSSCAEDETDEGFEYEADAGVVQNALSVLAFSGSDSSEAKDSTMEYEGLDIFDLEDCYSIVYPITIHFPGGSSQAVESDEQLEMILEDWEDMNLDASEYPTIEYPIQLADTLGTTIEVANDEEFCAILAACEAAEELEEFDCFDLVYPVTLVLPDGVTSAVSSFEEFQVVITDWYVNNPDDEADITFMYPISVVIDGAIQVIQSDEEFEPILESCEGEEYDEDDDDDDGN